MSDLLGVAAKYFEIRGMEVLDATGKVFPDGVVVKDGDELVFATAVLGTEQEGLPGPAASARSRTECEMAAARWLAGSDLVNRKVRFDEVAILPVGKDNGLVRHSINVLS